MYNETPDTNPLLDLTSLDSDQYDWYGIDLADEKAFRKLIVLTEAICRRSVEYSLWAGRTKMLAKDQNEDTRLDDSSFCPICGLSYEYVDPESHHHPITLFNLVKNKFQSWIDSNDLSDKRPLDLAYEVMIDHAQNKIEHVVLCKHCHEKYHNGLFEVKEQVDKIMEFKRKRKEQVEKETLPEAILKEKAARKKKAQDLREASFSRRVHLFTDELGFQNLDSVNSTKNELIESLQTFVDSVKDQNLNTEFQDKILNDKEWR